MFLQTVVKNTVFLWFFWYFWFFWSGREYGSVPALYCPPDQKNQKYQKNQKNTMFWQNKCNNFVFFLFSNFSGLAANYGGAPDSRQDPRVPRQTRKTRNTRKTRKTYTCRKTNIQNHVFFQFFWSGSKLWEQPRPSPSSYPSQTYSIILDISNENEKKLVWGSLRQNPVGFYCNVN